MKRPVVFAGIAVLAAAVITYPVYRHFTGRHHAAEQDTATLSSWTWNNPYTNKQVLIPPAWKKVVNDHLRDAVLALQHQSGNCLVYMTYDQSVNHLSAPEYIDAIAPMNRKEYGINELRAVKGKDGSEYYQGEGARYLGDKLVNVDVRIWNDGADGYWETVIMADMEYKSLEYDARDLAGKLWESTW